MFLLLGICIIVHGKIETMAANSWRYWFYTYKSFFNMLWLPCTVGSASSALAFARYCSRVREKRKRSKVRWTRPAKYAVLAVAIDIATLSLTFSTTSAPSGNGAESERLLYSPRILLARAPRERCETKTAACCAPHRYANVSLFHSYSRSQL